MLSSLAIGRLSYAIVPTPYHLFHNQKSVLAICDHERREILVRENLSDDALRAILLDVMGRILATVRCPGDLLEGYRASSHEAGELRAAPLIIERLNEPKAGPSSAVESASDGDVGPYRRFD